MVSWTAAKLAAASETSASPLSSEARPEAVPTGGLAKAKPAGPLHFSSGVYSKDTAWTYRVTLRAADGRVDELSERQFLVVREVVSAKKRGDRTLLRIRTTGGHDKRPRWREMVVGDRCVFHARSGKRIWCLPTSDVDAGVLEADGFRFHVVQVQDSKTRLQVDPSVGPVREETTGVRGRSIVRELVGYRIGGRRAGDARPEAIICDWDSHASAGAPIDQLGADDVVDKGYRFSDAIPGPYRRFRLKLSGRNAVDSLVAYASDVGATRLLLKKGRKIRENWVVVGALKSAKAWREPGRDVDWIALTFETTTAVTKALIRLDRTGRSPVQLLDWRFPTASGRTYFLYIVAELDGCAFKIVRQAKRRRAPVEVKVATLAVDEGGHRFAGGTLKLPDKGKDEQPTFGALGRFRGLESMTGGQ